MKSLKFLLVVLFVISAMSLYLGGCAPAETTTGKLAYQQKDWEKAEKELTKGVAIDKNDAEAWYMLGYSQVELGKYAEAQKSFKTVLSLSRDYDNLIKNYWIDKYNAGIKDYNDGTKALGKKDTSSSNAYFQRTIKTMNAAIAIMPDSAAAYQLMADSYNYMGQSDKALEIYQSVLDKSKSKEDAIQIARIMYQNGIKARQSEEYEKALGIFNRIIPIPFLPKDNIYYESSLFNIGFANYQIAVKKASDGKGKSEYEPYLKEAVKSIEQVVATSKDKALLKDSYEILYNAYDALGEKAKADDALNKKNALQ